MAQHSRNIDNSNSTGEGPVSGGLRTLILFMREDLLVCTTPVDPVTGNGVSLPFGESTRVGVNIQDVVVPRYVAPENDEDPKPQPPKAKRKAKGKGKGKGKNKIPTYRTLRPHAEYFIPAEKRDDSEEPEELITDSLLTGGQFVADEGEVIRVLKKSSVSISTVTLRLAMAMEGGYEEARNRIADMAAEAWKKDIDRAFQLYQLINAAEEKRVDEEKIPAELKATAAISQEIESKILKSACLWFGVDPDAELPKFKGKRAKRKPRNYFDSLSDVAEESQEGDFIVLSIRGESVRAALIADFNGIPEGTDLSGVSMLSLVELLGALKEKEHETDAEFLQVYLNYSWPNWEERISGMSAAQPQSDDPHEILGVARNATRDEIKTAYRRIMMRVHPDHSGLNSYFSVIASNAYKRLIAEGL